MWIPKGASLISGNTVQHFPHYITVMAGNESF